MIDSLVHISNIALMEHRLPRTGGEADATLWEGDELTVRFLLEEGASAHAPRALTHAR